MIRLNKLIAERTGLSRRKADELIGAGKVTVAGTIAQIGQVVNEQDEISVNNQKLPPESKKLLVMLNKPPGYVTSRDGQGCQTIYDLLPPEFNKLKPIGRLDKNSSGLLLITDDGDLANSLAHPSANKLKIYEVTLEPELSLDDLKKITSGGVSLSDGRPSKFNIERLQKATYKIQIAEGRNRQIRRTFEALGYKVAQLHRKVFGPYDIGDLPAGKYKLIKY